ncbi:uncharacterized protein LOC144149211 [Haemaphysalis longicornis]
MMHADIPCHPYEPGEVSGHGRKVRPLSSAMIPDEGACFDSGTRLLRRKPTRKRLPDGTSERLSSRTGLHTNTSQWPHPKQPLLRQFVPAPGFQSAWLPRMNSPHEVQVMTLLTTEQQNKRRASSLRPQSTAISASLRPAVSRIKTSSSVHNPELLQSGPAALPPRGSPARAPSVARTAGRPHQAPAVTDQTTLVKSQPPKKVSMALPNVVRNLSFGRGSAPLEPAPRSRVAFSSDDPSGMKSPISPMSPVLDSGMFEDSDSVQEPQYELSDTTILDVNPCLLIPLSTCNFMIILASLGIFLAAVYAHFDRESSGAEASVNTWLVYVVLNFHIVLMVASLLLFFVGSVGFLGALRENICLLELYASLQGFFTIMYTFLMVFVLVLPVIGRSFILSHITPDLIVHYRDNDDYRREIDYVQSSLRCCGMTEHSYQDWNVNQYFNCSVGNPSAERCSVPPSCCRKLAEEGYDDAGHLEPGFAREAQAVTDIDLANDDDDEEVEIMGTTLCGRGVMNMTEQKAWKRIYIRGCGPAMFQYVSVHVIEICLFSVLLIVIHLILLALAVAVRGQIKALAKVYDKYYKVVYKGQKSMAKRRNNLLEDWEESARNAASQKSEAPLVSTPEERRLKHRRRYLHHVPAWKRLRSNPAPLRNSAPVKTG